jgi:hypothetical protein
MHFSYIAQNVFSYFYIKSFKMKSVLVSVILFFSATILHAQQAQFMTYNSMMKIKASKNGEPVEWENPNVSVRFDYRSGEFITYLTNTDFVKPGSDINITKESDVPTRQLTLEGTLPISDIINQKQESQNYMVELNLKNTELNLSETILFDLLITKPETGNSKAYRVFTMNGLLYNDQTNFPAFNGYENEIQIWLIFSGFMNVQ